MDKILVSEVICDNDIAGITVTGLINEPGVAYKVFKVLAKHNINIDMIIQSMDVRGNLDISFTVIKENADQAAKIITEIFRDFEDVEVDKTVAKVSIVGAGMHANAGVAAKMFEALYDANINIRMISTSESSVTVLVDESGKDRAMKAIHNKFDLSSK